jgi:cobalamin biosynthetic protein CobC
MASGCGWAFFCSWGSFVPEHGGALRAAARNSRVALEAWLDLSTGINPEGWPVPAVPPEVWRRLPEACDGLEASAAAYYGNVRLLAVPGSQAAIQLLPALFPPAAIVCLAPLYAEHPAAWRSAGHEVRISPPGDLQGALAAAAPHVLLCNPNNPTAHRLGREAVLDAASRLSRRGGWLFVDEAFADAEVEADLSVSDAAGSPAHPNLVVFRSLGKFFGLAGIRAGFVLGHEDLLTALARKLGPWAVSHPARWIAARALADHEWRDDARRRLAAASARLRAMLMPLAGRDAPAACALFVTLAPRQADALADFLRGRAILARLFSEAGLLRFGLPGSAPQWERLAAALAAWSERGCRTSGQITHGREI